MTDEYAVAGGRRRDFQSGVITWDATSGATTVTTPAGQLQPGPGDLIVFGYPRRRSRRPVAGLARASRGSRRPQQR